MNLGNIIYRTDLLIKKYEKYDFVKEEKSREERSGDQFMDDLLLIMSQIEELKQRAEEVVAEKNRALKAAMNAEIRKSKNVIREDITERLEKNIKKGKGSTEEVVEMRKQKIQQALDALDAVPDGAGGIRRPMKAVGSGPSWTSRSAGKPTLNIEASSVDERQRQENHYSHTAETHRFQQDWELPKKRQDKQLDNIERGLDTLKGLGQAMNEGIKKQEVLINDAEEKIDDVAKDLRTSNMKLKGLVTKVRSTRMFIIDVVLLCVLLGIGLYIYNVVRK